MARALLLAAQGVQHSAMLEPYLRYPWTKSLLRRADAALGQSVSPTQLQSIIEGPETALARTENAQPAILFISYVALSLQELYGTSASCFAAVLGPSLGEYSAAVISGALSLERGLQLARFRGREMQNAVASAATSMVAINLPHTEVQAAINSLKDAAVCEVSGITNPRQTLVSGHTSAVDRLITDLKRRAKVAVIPMQVSAPFHCSLMQPAAVALKGYLQNVAFEKPGIPIISSRGEVVHTAEDLRQSLCENVTAPMRLVQSVEKALALGVRKFIEVGPRRKMGKQVLAIAAGLAEVSVSHYESDDKR